MFISAAVLRWIVESELFIYTRCPTQFDSDLFGPCRSPVIMYLEFDSLTIGHDPPALKYFLASSRDVFKLHFYSIDRIKLPRCWICFDGLRIERQLFGGS